jgi:hypothetical protein
MLITRAIQVRKARRETTTLVSGRSVRLSTIVPLTAASPAPWAATIGRLCAASTMATGTSAIAAAVERRVSTRV